MRSKTLKHVTNSPRLLFAGQSAILGPVSLSTLIPDVLDLELHSPGDSASTVLFLSLPCACFLSPICVNGALEPRLFCVGGSGPTGWQHLEDATRSILFMFRFHQ